MVEVDSVRAMRRKSMDMRLAVGAQTAFSSLLLATVWEFSEEGSLDLGTCSSVGLKRREEDG